MAAIWGVVAPLGQNGCEPEMKSNTLSDKLMGFSPLLLLVPPLTLGPRSFYAFEFLPAIFAIMPLFAFRIRTSAAGFCFVLCLLFFALLTMLLQVVLLGTTEALVFFRLLNLVLLFLIMLSTLENTERIVRVAAFSFSVAVALAYGQILDWQIFSGGLGINRLVATLYPYTGTLDERGLGITGGLSLKTNSALSPTSIGSGHTIIAGNLFAVISIALLYWRKPFLFSMTALVTVLTFSRGSWLILFIGVVLVLMGSSGNHYPRVNLKTSVQLLVGSIFGALTLYLSPFWDYMVFRVQNTLGVFGFITNYRGTLYDPRTTEVWPTFIEQMNEIGFIAWAVGSNLTIPTDSGILLVFRESGGLGFFFFLALGIGLYVSTRRDRLVRALLLALLVGSVFNPVHQGYQLIFVVIFVSAIQGVNYFRQRTNAHASNSPA